MKKPHLALLAILMTSGAFAATSTLWSTRIGDVVYPFSQTTIGDTVRGGMAPVNGALSYTKVAPATGFQYTFGNFQQEMLFEPAGTLAAGYITMAPQPIDGGKACMFSTEIITSMNLSANTGQSINNAITTLGAAGRACYLYSKANATWDRSR